MRRFCRSLPFFALAFALFLCAGCADAPPPSDVLEYQKNAAEVSVSGLMGELEFSAVITLAACEDAARRDLTVEYTAPQALCGIVVTCRAGACEARLGAVSTAGEAARRLARPADAFALGGNILDISAENGETLVKLENGEVALADGKPRRITLLCADGTALSLKIEKYIYKEGTKYDP